MNLSEMSYDELLILRDDARNHPDDPQMWGLRFELIKEMLARHLVRKEETS